MQGRISHLAALIKYYFELDSLSEAIQGSWTKGMRRSTAREVIEGHEEIIVLIMAFAEWIKREHPDYAK